MEKFFLDLSAHVALIRKNKPLVLCLTNYVTMDFVANVLLALGALPLMSVAKDELNELIGISSAVLVNIGTLDESFAVQSYEALMLKQKLKKPLILDPVGAGASAIRTELSLHLANGAEIIKGNASEIIALVDDKNAKTLGVESSHTTKDAKDVACGIAKKFSSTVVVSGKEDFITDSLRRESLYFGSAMMSRVTGMGCALGGVIAAFRAVIEDSFLAAYFATAYFSLCGTILQSKSNAPASFRTVFIDEIYNADFSTMSQHISNIISQHD